MCDFSELIAGYYNDDPQREWERAERHRTEHALTWKALKAHLPPPPKRILDCGGGPGRFSVELAREGYHVTLFDLSSGNLDLARQKARQTGIELEAYELGSAVDLSRFASESFEAVLLMGPLYHLLEPSDRQKAVMECMRLLKPGGLLFAAFICRYAGFRNLAMVDPGGIISLAPFIEEILSSGRLLPRGEKSAEFVAHFIHPDEIDELIWEAGLELRQIIGLEGLVSMIEEQLNQAEPEIFERWADLNYDVGRDPITWGGAEHLLAVAVKPLWKCVLREIAAKLIETRVPFKVVGGASAALHGVRLPVKDIDIELSSDDAYRFQELFADHAQKNVAFVESLVYRSHFGVFDFEGVKVDVSGDLERREGDGWVPTWTLTLDRIDLDGVDVPVSWLEEEILAYIRRDRMERATECLAKCNRERLLKLLRGEQEAGVI